MPFLLFWPDKQAMAQAGYATIAAVPVIFNHEWKYQPEASWFMRDRSKGIAVTQTTGRRSFPTRSSLETYARWLIDFLEWLEATKTDWRFAEYKNDLIEGYQRDMLNGNWTASVQKRPLKPSTINSRLDEAMHFLRWAERMQLRPPFDVLCDNRVRYFSQIGASAAKYTQSQRVGRVRNAPVDLRLPSDSEVLQWWKGVQIRHGDTLALMCELIIKTGIRREECAQWRVDTLPKSSDDWDISGTSVCVKLMFGTKGPKHLGKNDEEIGPPRFINLPLELAYRLHEYWTFNRAKIRMRYVNNALTPSERRARLFDHENRLFLSEYDGRAIDAKTLYRAWCSSLSMPYSGWSPHLGRHYWACRTLLDLYRRREQILPLGTMVTADWVGAGVNSDILMIIKPQLGHLSNRTVETYFVWVYRFGMSPEKSEEWINFLEDLTLPKDHDRTLG